MEVYILDSFLRRIAVVDRYESLIWTDRFKELGDFKLTVISDTAMRSLFKEDTLIAINDSYRVMVVENIEAAESSEGKKILTITGRSLELILMNRVAMGSISGLGTTPTWNLTGTPSAICRQIFDDICRTGILKAGDIIDYLTTGSLLPTDTIGEATTVYTLQIAPKSVYAAIKAICDVYDLGFRLIRDPETAQLYFDIYTGVNRTSGQSTDTPILFSKELDNLTNTKEFTSIENQKNAAYVYSTNGALVVYNDGTDDTTKSFNRKVLMVDASDIDELLTGQELIDALTQRGEEALADYRGIVAFDGEINQKSGYKYGVHYNVGDLVEQQNADGFANQMRVTEQILVSDTKGERSYPTISKNLSITPGSWISWDFSKTWLDYDADFDTVWATLP